MDKYLLIDCEATGLPPRGPKVPADHPTQPWLAHLAMVFLDHDLRIERQVDMFVKPDGWTMPDEAFAINGLSTRFLADYGQPLADVMDVYVAAVLEPRVVVAYNAEYDLRLCRGSLRRPDHFEDTRNICLMRAYKAWRQIFKGYKLIDACTYLGIPTERLHRALADALVTVEVFRAMRDRGAPIPEPAVYTSKNHDEIVARGVS